MELSKTLINHPVELLRSKLLEEQTYFNLLNDKSKRMRVELSNLESQIAISQGWVSSLTKSIKVLEENKNEV